MRISDWSSDVCSSDLTGLATQGGRTRVAKRKTANGWQRDPEGMRLRILEAATQEFSRHGLGGARIDRIAKAAGANKRMIYYHVGNKEDLYLAVPEATYAKRSQERPVGQEGVQPGKSGGYPDP